MDLHKTQEEIQQEKKDYYKLLEDKNYQAEQELKPFEVSRITDLNLGFPVYRLSEVHELFDANELRQLAGRVDTNLSIFISSNRCFALQREDCEINPFLVAKEMLGVTLEPNCAFVLVKSLADINFEDLKHFTSIRNSYIVTPEKIWKIPRIDQIHQFVFQYRMEANLDALIESGFVDVDTLTYWLEEDIKLYEKEISKNKEMKEHFQKFLTLLENHEYKQLNNKLTYDELLDLRFLLKAADLNGYLAMNPPIFPQGADLAEYSTEKLNDLSRNLRAFMGELLGNIEKERLYNYLTSIEELHRFSEEAYRESLENLLKDTSDFRQYQVINSKTLPFFHRHFIGHYQKHLGNATYGLSDSHYKFITDEIKKILLRQILADKNQDFLVPVDITELNSILKS